MVVDGDSDLDIEKVTIPNGDALTFGGVDDVPAGGVAVTMTSEEASDGAQKERTPRASRRPHRPDGNHRSQRSHRRQRWHRED
jgi:hypothetical protein